MNNTTKNWRDYADELDKRYWKRSIHSIEESRSYLKESFSLDIKYLYLAERKEPLSDTDMAEIEAEIERWFSCKMDRAEVFNEKALEAILEATDCTNPNAALVLANVAMDITMGDVHWDLLDGLFSDNEFVLHAPYRGNAEKKLFWSLYSLSGHGRKISTPDAIRLTKENGDVFLNWLVDISTPCQKVLENQDEFGAFIKNSEWNEWTEDVMW